MKFVNMSNLPTLLMTTGLALAVIEELTYKSGVGGMVFGDKGYLKGINDLLPAWKVPGTTTTSVRYPSGYPISLAVWLLLAGIALGVYRRAQ